jgi:hypothetical protein
LGLCWARLPMIGLGHLSKNAQLYQWPILGDGLAPS